MSAPLLRRLFAACLLAVVAALALAAPASAAPAPTAAASSTWVPPRLTPVQEATVLKLIDDICGDTWCEGDSAFDFRHFACHPRLHSCTLRLRIAPLTDEPLRWTWRSGEVHGFTRYGQMVRTSAGGATSLQPAFYDAVNELVNRLEASVPRRGQPVL